MTMNYTTLVAAKSAAGSIKQYANDDALPVSEVLADAEAWIYARLRVWQMLRTRTDLVFVVGSRNIALPDDFEGLRDFRITGANAQLLTLRTLAQVADAKAYNSSNAIVQEKPSIFYWDGTNFVFNTLADVAYPTQLIYYARPAALSGSNETNFLTTRYPHILRNACLGKAYEWKRSPGGLDVAALNKALADIEEANVKSDMAMQNMAVR